MRELSERAKQRIIGSVPGLSPVLFCPSLQGRGSSWLNRATNALHGTITGATWTRTPQGLWYLDFDATDDYVNFGTNSALRPAAWTWMGWVKTTKAGSQQLLAWAATETTPLVGPWSGDRIIIYMGAGNYRMFSPAGLTDGAWHHVIVKCPGSAQTSINTSECKVDNTVVATESTVATGAQSAKATCRLGGVGAATPDWKYVGGIAIPIMIASVTTDAQDTLVYTRQRRLLGV